MSHTFRIAACFGLFAALTAQARPQQFDLRCEGTLQEALDGDIKPHTWSVRIDLANNQWCWNSCERTFSIADVKPERIELVNEREDGRFRGLHTVTVDRRTGQFEQVSIQSRPVAWCRKVAGTCQPATFSGFPATRF